ncbi:MAG TPA: DUF480 domain-containing protein [Pirellulaceae bacterium]|nr:DUF480 domain-containing protein [Pirellulaceae bacterium]
MALAEHNSPHWQMLNSRQRRVFGVLIEKAKTTPDAYPMTLNGITTGCNQKTNREPLTNYTAEDVEQILEELRGLSAVVEVQGSGRVAKYKHLAYDWLGVDKVELAVMAELLLRNEQTVGELRGRAARMEPIADLAALKPVLESLIKKNLVISLTPEGRGQIVTHNLHKERELVELRARFANYVPPASDDEAPRAAPSASSATPAAPRPVSSAPSVTRDMFSELELDVAALRADVAKLRAELRDLQQQLGVTPAASEPAGE